MCGIVGYVGSQQVVEVLLDTLSSLEYRGYDSSGISVEKDNKIYTVKSRGPLSALKAKLASVDLSGSDYRSCSYSYPLHVIIWMPFERRNIIYMLRPAGVTGRSNFNRALTERMRQRGLKR